MNKNNPDWPIAVNPVLLCNSSSEEEKKERAIGIVDLMIDEQIEGKSFVDFGCGEGHVAERVADLGASTSTGYDIKQKWSNSINANLTTDLENVVKNGPYDYVLVYDVLDHCEDPIKTLKQVVQISHKNTKIFVRCHPWIGRHGGHLYQHENKAFIHLILTKEELSSYNEENIPKQKVFAPLYAYGSWIDKSGLQEINRHVSNQPVEKFFLTRDFINAFEKNVNIPTDNLFNWPEFQMKQNFIDYTLKVK